MKHQDKPIDASYIDFLQRYGEMDKIRFNSLHFSEFRQMSDKEISSLFWHAKEVFHDTPVTDPAWLYFRTHADRLHEFAHLRYLQKSLEYRERFLAVYFPLTARRSKDGWKILGEIMQTYSKGVFDYILTEIELVVIPDKDDRRSPLFLEFLETVKQFKITGRPYAVDASLWAPFRTSIPNSDKAL